MKPEIGISEKDLKESIDLLSTVLADEMTLYIKTRKFHWNVYGQSFMELHKLFEAQYTEYEEVIDQIAERISKLGGKTIGTMKQFSELTRLNESPESYPVQIEMIKELLKDHEAMAKLLRKDADDMAESKDLGTVDFLTGMLQQHETTAWTLRRYLN